jgi:hypothetical protein
MSDQTNAALAANLQALIEAGETGRECAGLADAVLAEVVGRMRAQVFEADLAIEAQEERITKMRAELRASMDGVAELRAFIASIEVVRAEAFKRAGGGL